MTADGGVQGGPGAEAVGTSSHSRLRVSALVAFVWRAGQLICDDALRHRQLALTEPAERLLRVFADWAPIDAAEPVVPGGRKLAGQLLAARILVAEGSDEHRRERELGAWHELGETALRYHLATRTHDADEFATREQDGAALRARADSQPAPYLVRSADHVALPPPGEPPGALAATLASRRSTRDFDRTTSLDVERVSTLLHWAFGARYEVDVTGLGVALLKTSPSGGARHPIEVYPVLRRVDGVQPGVYHYSVRRHALEPIAEAPDDAALLHWCGGQQQAVDAAVLLFYTALIDRTAWKYPHARAYRAPLLDLGHLSQTVYLTATALDFGVFFTAATRDEPVEERLGLDWTREILLGVSGLGVPTAAERERQHGMRAGERPGFSFPRGVE